eukprot:824428-Rhodomonas_salina.2
MWLVLIPKTVLTSGYGPTSLQRYPIPGRLERQGTSVVMCHALATGCPVLKWAMLVPGRSRREDE